MDDHARRPPNGKEAPSESPNSESSNRWWEFYAVRYAMGTVVGSVAVLFLCAQRPDIQSLLPGTLAVNLSGADTAKVFSAAAYGLIYCYIASAPILVFHA